MKKIDEVDRDKKESRIIHNWQVIGRSIRGILHERVSLPKQDEIGWEIGEGSCQTIILAVSDGHGSESHFRSQIGARLAVEATKKSFGILLKNIDNLKTYSSIKSWAEKHLPINIYKFWKDSVADHIYNHQFETNELSQLKEKVSIIKLKQIILDPIRAYGATIMGVMITDDFIICIQLGDGDIVFVSDNGDTTKPIPEDERIWGNYTTSLCSRKAWKDFYVHFHPINNTIPALIMVSTDGLSNSYPDEKDFINLSSKFLESIRSDGIKKVDEGLEDWLKDVSCEGSEDDITLGLIFRKRSLKYQKEITPELQRNTEDKVDLGSTKTKEITLYPIASKNQ